MSNHHRNHSHGEGPVYKTKAQHLLSNLSPEEAGAVMTALYDYGYNVKTDKPDVNHVKAIAKGLSHAALAGDVLPTKVGDYH